MHFKKSSHGRAFRRGLAMCIGLTLLTGGVTALANNTPVNVTGNLDVDATNMTGSNKLNKVTVSDNLSATVTNGSNIWTVTNRSDKGWTTIGVERAKMVLWITSPWGILLKLQGIKTLPFTALSVAR